MSQPDPLAPIQDDSDRAALAALNLQSLDDVWKKVADEGGAFFRGFPDDRRQRLVRDLIQAAKPEAQDGQTSGFGRFWPDLLLGLLLLVFLSLGVRAFCKADSVAIALRGLRAGERLRSEDLHGAAGLERPKAKQEGPALRLKTGIPAGGYIFPANLERVQVIALRPIAARSIIPADAIRQEWKPYGRKSTAMLEQVVGNQATRDIARGATVRPEDVESESVLVQQVVAGRRIPRLHRIVARDLRLELRPRRPRALLRLDEAIGHYPLQEVEAGTTLAQGNLSPGALTPDSLAGRQLVTLRVHPPSFRLLPQLPARVTLAVAAPKNAGSFLLQNAIALDVESGSNGPAVVVALTAADLQGLLPLLPDAEVFVLQPSP